MPLISASELGELATVILTPLDLVRQFPIISSDYNWPSMKVGDDIMGVVRKITILAKSKYGRKYLMHDKTTALFKHAIVFFGRRN